MTWSFTEKCVSFPYLTGGEKIKCNEDYFLSATPF